MVEMEVEKRLEFVEVETGSMDNIYERDIYCR